jgi:hypothetical protein
MLRSRLVLLLAAAMLVPSAAIAQAPAATGAAAAPTATATASGNTITVVIPQGATTATAAGGDVKPVDDKGPKSPQNLAGYGYGDAKPRPVPPPQPGARRVARRATTGPIATFPGFEMTGDGGSRLFVQLTQQVPVEERRAAGSITYVLKGARVNVWNNHNALVTVHFNTPVTRARLLSVGNDLHFVVELRSAATPTYNVAAAQGGSGAVLSVVFPKGEYLSGNEETDAEAAQKAAPAPQAAPAAPKKRKK